MPDPNFFQHENPTLTAIFNDTVPQVVQVLAKFDSSHPVVEDYSAYFKPPEGDRKKRHIHPARDAHVWIESCGLPFNPEIE
jgi:hypothetical protein